MKFINPKNGKTYYFARSTFTAGLVPRSLLPYKAELKQKPKEPDYQVTEAKTQDTEEPDKEPDQQDTSRMDMITHLRKSGIRVGHNIGDDKLKERYNENT